MHHLACQDTMKRPECACQRWHVAKLALSVGKSSNWMRQWGNCFCAA